MPDREPRLLNYDHRAWGHNQELEQVSENHYRGWIFAQGSVRVNDLITWRTGYGRVLMRITSLERGRDVHDQYLVEADVFRRVDTDWNVLWEAHPIGGIVEHHASQLMDALKRLADMAKGRP